MKLKGVLPVIQTPFLVDGMIESATGQCEADERMATLPSLSRSEGDKFLDYYRVSLGATFSPINVQDVSGYGGNSISRATLAVLIFEGAARLVLVDSHFRENVGTMAGSDVPRVSIAIWPALQAGSSQRAGEVDARLGACRRWMDDDR